MPGPSLPCRTSRISTPISGSSRSSSAPATTRSSGRFHHQRPCALDRLGYVDDSVVDCNVKAWLRSRAPIGHSRIRRDAAACVETFVTYLHTTVVIGAGPYGLSVAAHLGRRGRPVTVIGVP